MARDSLPRLIATYRTATSTEAVTRLSYAETQRACAHWCRSRQISPCDPVASRQPHQPTCPGWVRPSQAAPSVDLHHFTTNRVSTVTSAPVSVSPNPTQSGQVDWVEEGSCTPQRPASAAPAPLRARGFGGDCCEGWRPSQLSLDWRSRPLRYTNSLRFQNEGKTNFSCSCVGKSPTIGQCRL